MSEPNVYDPAAIHAYDVVATALSAPTAMAAWVDGHVPLHGARILDLGAGTGISALALADAGADVVAVDASPESLDVLEHKRDGRAIRTVRADFRSVRLEEEFAAVVLSRNTFFSAESLDDKVALLGTVAAHLAPGGVAFLDCTDPAEFLRGQGDASSLTYPLGRDRAVAITQTADRSRQMVLSTFVLWGATDLVAFHETATWATAPEIELMARMTGLEVDGICGGYDGQPYDSRSREMLVRLRSVT